MMARLAEYRDDTSGLLATGGTSTAYTVTTNQVLAATPNDGQLIAVTPHVTNGVAPTLAADGGTAFPIQTSAGTAVGAAVLLLGTPYVLKFAAGSSAWVLVNFTGNPYNIPLGGLLFHTVNSAPNSNFAFANGQAISRTTYASYFSAVSTTYGAGDGVTTFNVPDLRGRGVFGLDGMGGSSVTTRISVGGGNFDGSVLANSGGNQSRTIAQNQLPNVTIPFSGTGTANPSNGAQFLTTGAGSISTGAGFGQSVSATVAVNGNTNSINGGVLQNQLAVLSPAMVLPIFVRIF